MSASKSDFIKSREKFFNRIVDKFPHEKLSNLIVSHKIDRTIFKKLSNEVNQFFYKSKKFNFHNMTPNGKLNPKKRNRIRIQ